MRLTRTFLPAALMVAMALASPANAIPVAAVAGGLSAILGTTIAATSFIAISGRAHNERLRRAGGGLIDACTNRRQPRASAPDQRLD